MSNENVDYDKQFQADLERAQALSLETLALEKFRNQKRLKELVRSRDSTDSPRTPVDRERDEPTRSESFKLKSRPRPGTLTPVQSSSIIAPPPPSQRKNSNASGSKLSEGPDLISFTSPPSSNSKLIDFQQDVHKLSETTAVISQNQFTVHQQIGFHRQMSLVRPLFSQMPQQISFQNGYGVPSIPLQTPDQMFQNQTAPGNRFQFQDVPQNVQNFPPANSSASGGSCNLDVLKILNKQDNSNLIDLATFNYDNASNAKASVLEAFDPLCSPKQKPAPPLVPSSPEYTGDDCASVCSGSMYEEYDPFEYLSGSGSISDPIYATINRSDTKVPLSPPPLPPRQSQSTLERKRNTRKSWIYKKKRLYENLLVGRKQVTANDCDLHEFYRLITKIRRKCKYDDSATNSGIVISPMMANQYKEDISIKLCIYPRLDNSDSVNSDTPPVIFTCNVSCSVEHVTLHVVCELDAPPTGKYSLKVWGLTEYLAAETSLSDYEYVHNCIKLEQDVVLCLVPDRMVDRSLARTALDDRRDSNFLTTELIPNDADLPITYDSVVILLETLEKEMDRVELAAREIENSAEMGERPKLKHSGVMQAVKAVCTLMGSLETPEITEALGFFVSTCESYPPQPTFPVPRGNFEDPIYAEIQRPRSLVEAVHIQCNHIRNALQALLQMYCYVFRVDFHVGSSETVAETKMISEIPDWIAIRICAVYRPPVQWKHDNYGVEAQVYHGTRKVGGSFTVPSLIVTTGVSPRILFNSDLIMEGVSFCTLARESRIVLVLNGFTMQQPSDNNENSSESQFVKEELGWAAFQLFNYEGVLAQGGMLLSLWPPAANKMIGPAPSPGSHPVPDHPLLGVELIVSHPQVLFPAAPRPTSPEVRGDFSSLDLNTQQQLLEIIDQDTLSNPPVEIREVLWEKRHYLYHLPAALPKVLLAAHSWDWASLGNLHVMLHHWTPMEPLQALQLLLPCFPDTEVRKLAVKWIRNISNDELVDYLPQLVQALKHETYESSTLCEFLLEKALSFPRFLHHLFWLLSHTLPGDFPENSTWTETTAVDEARICHARYSRRLQIMLRALISVSGDAVRQNIVAQQLLCKNLYEIAEEVKQAKESIRLKVMCGGLEGVHQNLEHSPSCLPLSPSLRVAGVQVRTCSYFPSNTLPLKINFIAPDSTIVPAIFKVGDDLQQDMLTIQMVRIMDKLWLREGLDLKMVTFACVPTGYKRGMIEMVGNAETLRKIQVEWGLTGSFKDKPIAEWLAKHNPSELEYERARENFTASCAGYSVVTYILGICDRHNDNIMLKTSGHVFHIDFGKFLGDAQMFGNFKRDRTPFVLTSDMAFVINGGDRPSARFHKFVDLCCQAFNIVRSNGNLILNLFTFMASSGIPGVTTEAVNYVRNALLPDKSNPEAAAFFARLIQSSLKSWFTQFNFFLHNLAQLRFTGDHGDGELLSFVPKTYNKNQEGRLCNVKVCGYEKRYDPDKYYVYILMVERDGQPHPTNIFRTYKEFCELHQKLCLHFPLAKIHSLPTGIHMGRSNIKQVAEKRLHDIRMFIYSLFLTADEIAHSDLVYTFFHPMLRDQQNMELFNKRSKGRGNREDVGRVRGQLKLTLHYQRGALSVMVHHARSLPLMAGAQEPSTYVKVYLLPDPTKSTKRKTKVVKRNCHPSFMEMLEYRLSLDVIRSRTLQATVWNHDPLQENEFLGGVALELSSLDLSIEQTEWFPLTNVSR